MPRGLPAFCFRLNERRTHTLSSALNSSRPDRHLHPRRRLRVPPVGRVGLFERADRLAVDEPVELRRGPLDAAVGMRVGEKDGNGEGEVSGDGLGVVRRGAVLCCVLAAVGIVGNVSLCPFSDELAPRAKKRAVGAGAPQ